MSGIRQAVHERYSAELEVMDRADFEEFVTARTAALELEADQLAMAARAELTRRWEAEHDRPIGYLEQVALHRRARQSADETVLAQLWEGEPEPEPELAPVPAMARWGTPEASDPTEETEALVARLWPQQAQQTRFRVLAEDLLAARDEDGLTVPTDPADPLAAELAAVVADRAAQLAAAVEELGRS